MIKETILLCFLLLLHFLILIYALNNKKKHIEWKENNQLAIINKIIPRHIWTYWEGGKIPKSVKMCIESWKKHNPDYEITILNDKLVKKLITFDIELLNIPEKFIQRKSDFVRLFIIESYGGIWIDSSIFCNEPLSWIPMKGYDFIGFVSPQTNDDDLTLPIIENWFFAAPPKSPLICDWLEEAQTISLFTTEEDYVEHVKNTGIDTQGLTLPYLVMHLALLRITSKNKDKYIIKLFNSISDNGPFKYLNDVGWNSRDAINLFLNGKTNDQKLVKMRGYEREILENILENKII